MLKPPPGNVTVALPGSSYFMFLISSPVFIPLPPSCLLLLSSEWIFPGTSLSLFIFQPTSPSNPCRLCLLSFFFLLFIFEFIATLVHRCDRSLQGRYRGHFRASYSSDNLNMDVIRVAMCFSRTLRSLEVEMGLCPPRIISI